MSLVAVFLLALLAVDVFLSVREKNWLQNGGDAAALAAAHRQGELINEIGRLNIEHIKAALNNETNRCLAIGLEQRRLALVEPVFALRFASEAARKNGLEDNEDFSRILEMHVNDIQTLYANGSGEGDPFPESYPGAWNDYAIAVSAVASEGLAAGADNIEFYWAYGNHMLLDPDFYSAVAGEDWCWFWFRDKNLLDSYSSHNDWAPLPVISGSSTENSEIFSLHLSATTNALTSRFTVEEIFAIANEYGGMNLKIADFTREDGSIAAGLLAEPGYTWFLFDTRYWRMWFDGKRLADADDDDSYEYPIVGTIKDEYNVRGCAAVCRTLGDAHSFTTDADHTLSWHAAAKPFGTVETLDGRVEPVTALNGFVVPCMTDTRLVSVDSVGSRNLNTADLDWLTHMRFHLPDYMLNGPRSANACWYCAQLVKWERPTFHHRGSNWLKYHSGECIRPVGGTYRGTGGTSHGH